jgi:hypothetical protein
MNFLGLVNAVLTRLREEQTTVDAFNSTPYLRTIGACVNDAKSSVENAWQWGALRGIDQVTAVAGNAYVTLPDSQDNHFILRNVLFNQGGVFLRPMTNPKAQELYAQRFVTPPPTGAPSEYAPGQNFYNESNPQDPVNGSAQILLWPIPDQNYDLSIYRVKHQQPLVEALDIIKVPSLPVYSLAAALASRERGEVGSGTISELFATAQSHLSDAIASDSARFGEELIWFVPEDAWNTNVGFA